MKTSKKSLQPSLALALVAVIAPIIAAIAPSYAAEPVRSIFDVRLFDAAEFRLLRREVHPAQQPDIARGKPGSQTSSLSTTESSDSSDSSVSSSAASSEDEDVLIFESLTGEQRETLRRQLRAHACPQEAEVAYRKLCERMLKAMPAFRVRQGLTNPNQ